VTWFGCSLLVGARAFAQQAPPSQAPTEPVGDKARARECFDAAQTAYLAGRLDEARRGFECAYAQLPSSAELIWNLARVCERMGDVEYGVRYFREYLARAKTNPRERRGIEARIRALLDLEARQSAHPKPGPEVNAALSGEARNFFVRGAKLYRAGHFEAAAVAFTQALQLSNAPELHYNLAVASERMGNYQDAFDHYRAYLAASPEAQDRGEVEARIAELRAQIP
jgi:tetratricopeptide (TPR) repeat protein